MLDSVAGKFEEGFKLKLMLGVLSITYKLTPKANKASTLIRSRSTCFAH